MEINVYDEVEYNHIDTERLITILQSVTRAIDAKLEYELSLTLVSDEEIQRINREYRSKDQVTDVISFETGLHVVNIANMETVDLGDIFISVAQAKRQAEALNQSLTKEIEFLFIHGILHLFGYDHLNEVDEEEMFSLQRKIVNEIN
ncbi:MAG: rRNA maturation RNase YbeY [Erysipelothrix sp.]|nr:rRNA maturation RNase YbeY [Erysipelothrix sp.]